MEVLWISFLYLKVSLLIAFRFKRSMLYALVNLLFVIASGYVGIRVISKRYPHIFQQVRQSHMVLDVGDEILPHFSLNHTFRSLTFIFTWLLTRIFLGRQGNCYWFSLFVVQKMLQVWWGITRFIEFFILPERWIGKSWKLMPFQIRSSRVHL